MKPLLYIIAAVALSGAAATAQDLPAATAQAQTPLLAATPVLPSQKELDDALSLVRTTNLWGKLFDWKETGSSTETVVAHSRTLLGTEAPVIEIRGQDDSRSTFVLTQAKFGAVLCSLAELTDRRVWVFPGRLVIASEAALTDAERTALKDKKAGVWTQEAGWDVSRNLEQLTVTVVASDLKQKLAAKGQTAALAPPPAPRKPGEHFSSYELPFKELSVASQKALQDLVSTSRYNFAQAIVISPEALVCLDDSDERFAFLFFKEPGVEKPILRYFSWSAIKPRSASPAP